MSLIRMDKGTGIPYYIDTRTMSIHVEIRDIFTSPTFKKTTRSLS